MAVKDVTIQYEHTIDDYRVYKWENLTNTGSDSGAPISDVSSSDRSVQVIGTFGTGGTVLIEGSLDGTNYATLNDFQGNALSIQSAKIDSIAEAVRYIRPRISAGDSNTDVDVFILAKRTL